MFLGNPAKTLRLIFQALHLKKEPSCVAPRELPRANYVEQSWDNVRAKSLCFPAFAPKHCSTDLRFFLARRARLSRKVKSAGNSAVTIPLAKRLFFQPFRSRIVTASGDTFITRKKLRSAGPLDDFPSARRRKQFCQNRRAPLECQSKAS
jgi:hypothetical protein